MLPNEETTRSELTTRPGELEALLAVAGRDQARPLVAFLKEQRLNVTLVQDADSAFEEAVLHRPNLVVVHQDLPPVGGIEFCQRLKANTRTHFLPTIVFSDGLSQAARVQALGAGADAIFLPGDDPAERRARLWALLRTQALFRRHERKRESQGLALRERGQWLGTFMHDLQNAVGALQANFDFLTRVGQSVAGARPAIRPNDLQECASETHALLRQLAHGLRIMQEYERFESGRIGLKEGLFSPIELLHEVCAEVRMGARLDVLNRAAGVTVDSRPADEQLAATGDRDLLRRALGILVGLLRRWPGTTLVRMCVARSDQGVVFQLTGNGPPIPAAEEAQLFDPFTPNGRKGPIAERFELAVARAIVEVHRGRLQGSDGRETASFSVELRSRDSLPKSH
jgi:K+-sensing histidine kinase KdpD